METCTVPCGEVAKHYYRTGRWAKLICPSHGFELKNRGVKVYILPPLGTRFGKLLRQYRIAPIHGSGS